MNLVENFSPLLINLPVIITLIIITRYIIGFKTWRNYTSLALALAFFFINMKSSSIVLTFAVWLGLTISIIGIATATKYLLRKVSMNFYSRIAMMYITAISSFYLIGVLSHFLFQTNFFFSQEIIIAGFLIGSTIDDLATLQFKKSIAEFLRRLVVSVVLGLIGGLLLTWEWWNAFILNRFEILILILIVNIIVANWKNLRLTELLRFRSVTR